MLDCNGSSCSVQISSTTTWLLNVKASEKLPILFGMLLVYINDLLHLIIAAHEYTRTIMDMLRYHS